MSDQVSTSKPEDSASPKLVKMLRGSVDETKLREFVATSYSMLHPVKGSPTLTVRGWNASIEASNSSLGFSASWGSYVERTYWLTQIKGSERFAVKVLFNVAIDFSKNIPAFRDIDGNVDTPKFIARIKQAIESGETFEAFNEALRAERQEPKTAPSSRKGSPNKNTASEKVQPVKVATAKEAVTAIAPVARSVDIVAKVAHEALLLVPSKGYGIKTKEGARIVKALIATLSESLDKWNALEASTKNHPSAKAKARA